jgi:hypothetical protein
VRETLAPASRLQPPQSTPRKADRSREYPLMRGCFPATKVIEGEPNGLRFAAGGPRGVIKPDDPRPDARN